MHQRWSKKYLFSFQKQKKKTFKNLEHLYHCAIKAYLSIYKNFICDSRHEDIWHSHIFWPQKKFTIMYPKNFEENITGDFVSKCNQACL